MANSQYITGKAYWARVLPKQLHDNYNGDGKEWSLDVSLDEANVQKLTSLGLAPKIKNKGDDRGQFITFSRSELKKSGPKKGQENTPIAILDADGDDWDDRSIGNGSVVGVDFNVFQTEWKNKKFLKPAILAIHVLEWVEYKTEQRETGRRKADNTQETWEGDVV